MDYSDFQMMDVFGGFPSTDLHENCNDTSTDGDCNGENFTVMCVHIDIVSAIIVVVNFFLFVIGIIVVRRKMVQSIRICEFYLIINLAFSDMLTGILSLTIDAWDFITEVRLKISFKLHILTGVSFVYFF